MTENRDELRAEVVEHGVLDYDQAQELLDRVEAAEAELERIRPLFETYSREYPIECNKRVAAEAAVSNQRSVVKTLAERNVELTKFKDAYSLQAQELEQAEAERDFRQKENKELFEQIERVRELASEYRKTIPEEVLHSVMVDICRTLDGGEQE